ncbi:hypothetical protein D3C84_1046540 [compost metagenome]
MAVHQIAPVRVKADSFAGIPGLPGEFYQALSQRLTSQADATEMTHFNRLDPSWRQQGRIKKQIGLPGKKIAWRAARRDDGDQGVAVYPL